MSSGRNLIRLNTKPVDVTQRTVVYPTKLTRTVTSYTFFCVPNDLVTSFLSSPRPFRLSVVRSLTVTSTWLRSGTLPKLGSYFPHPDSGVVPVEGGGYRRPVPSTYRDTCPCSHSLVRTSSQVFRSVYVTDVNHGSFTTDHTVLQEDICSLLTCCGEFTLLR